MRLYRPAAASRLLRDRATHDEPDYPTLAKLTGIASVLPTTWAVSRSASDEIRNRERVVMAGAAHAFMEEYDVPGLAVAISREVRLVYAQS